MRCWAAIIACTPLLAFAGVGPAVETTHPMLDVTIVTNDGGQAADFYGGVLGLKAGPSADIANGAKLLRYQAGEATLKIVVPATKAAHYTDRMSDAIGIRGLVLYLPDTPEDFTKRLASHNRPPPNWVEGEKGHKRARLTDPDGNWLELLFGGNSPEPVNFMDILLMTSNEVRSRAFYGKTLGLQEGPTRGTVRGLLYAYTAGSSTILVREVNGLRTAPNRAGKILDATGFRAITFFVKDVDALQAELSASGVKIATPPFDHAGVMRTMYVVDPDGNYLEFDSPLPATHAARQ